MAQSFYVKVHPFPSIGKNQFCTDLGQQYREYERNIVQMIENYQVTQTSIVTKIILCPFWYDKCSKSFHGTVDLVNYVVHNHNFPLLPNQ